MKKYTTILLLPILLMGLATLSYAGSSPGNSIPKIEKKFVLQKTDFQAFVSPDRLVNMECNSSAPSGILHYADIGILTDLHVLKANGIWQLHDLELTTDALFIKSPEKSLEVYRHYLAPRLIYPYRPVIRLPNV